MPSTTTLATGSSRSWIASSPISGEPADHLEPLQGAPHDKLRVGQFRLGCRADRDAKVLYVLAIKKRGGDAYRGDDD